MRRLLAAAVLTLALAGCGDSGDSADSGDSDRLRADGPPGSSESATPTRTASPASPADRDGSATPEATPARPRTSSAAPTRSPDPTAAPTRSASAAPRRTATPAPVASAGSGSAAPASPRPSRSAATSPSPRPTGQLVITEADHGRTFTISMSTADALLRLGDGWLWSQPERDGSSVELTQRQFIRDPGYAEWEIRPVARGTTVIRSTGSMACHQEEPPCAAPNRLFEVTVVVSG